MFAYCNNNPILYIDKDGDMAAEATIVATNFWNPAGWIAAGIFVIEVVVCVCLIDDAVKNPVPTSPANNKKETATKSKSSVIEGQSSTASPPPPNNNNRDSKYRGDSTYNKNGIRVDYEYYGNGKGNVHVHTKQGKFYYDWINNVMRVGPDISSGLAPRAIQKLLEVPVIVNAIIKAVRFVIG